MKKTTLLRLVVIICMLSALTIQLTHGNLHVVVLLLWATLLLKSLAE
jgi:hypothetical protein